MEIPTLTKYAAVDADAMLTFLRDCAALAKSISDDQVLERLRAIDDQFVPRLQRISDTIPHLRPRKDVVMFDRSEWDAAMAQVQDALTAARNCLAQEITKSLDEALPWAKAGQDRESYTDTQDRESYTADDQ